jgi:hypothetical protein
VKVWYNENLDDGQKQSPNENLKPVNKTKLQSDQTAGI